MKNAANSGHWNGPEWIQVCLGKGVEMEQTRYKTILLYCATFVRKHPYLSLCLESLLWESPDANVIFLHREKTRRSKWWVFVLAFVWLHTYATSFTVISVERDNSLIEIMFCVQNVRASPFSAHSRVRIKGKRRRTTTTKWRRSNQGQKFNMFLATFASCLLNFQ